MRASLFIPLLIVLLSLTLPLCGLAQQAAGGTDAMPKLVTDLLEAYEKEIGAAKERPDKVLQNEVAKIAAKLVLEGNADAAKTISTQVTDKLAGKAASIDNPELMRLFELYDKARDTAIAPVRDKFLRHLDSLLQSPDGKDINVIIALGEAKKMIQSGELPATAQTDPFPTEVRPVEPSAGSVAMINPASGKKQLEELAMSKVWEYKTKTGIDLISFGKRGSVRWLRGGNNPGISTLDWKVNGDFIAISNSTEVRIDDSGNFGEVLYLNSNNRYRLHPSESSLPD